MAQDWAKWFYTSRSSPWPKCRDDYADSVGGLCEKCLRKGIVRAGVIVHHKVHLTPENIHDPNIALNWDNLELLCWKCHAEEHPKGHPKRYRVDEFGRVKPK